MTRVGSVSPASRPLRRKDRERLIEKHLPLVRTIARRYSGLGEPLDDLVQVGAMALVKAADRFEPSRGVAFATFATPAVEGEIRRHLGDQAGIIRIPRELQRISGQLRRSRVDLAAVLGRSPTVAELAEALKVEEHDIERALEAEHARASVSISDGAAPEVDAASEPVACSEDRLLLAETIRMLDTRQRRIVFLRFHADMTEREIAGAVGISQAHVSRLLAEALASLRAQLVVGSDVEEPGDIAAHAVISPVPTAAPGSDARPGRDAPGPRPVADGANRSVSRTRSDPEHATRRTAPSHSGRFLVRMPGSLHEQLAAAAEREQISLNRFVTDTLAASVADHPVVPPSPEPRPTRTDDAPPSRAPGRASRAFRVAVATSFGVVVFTGLAALALLILAVQRGI